MLDDAEAATRRKDMRGGKKETDRLRARFFGTHEGMEKAYADAKKDVEPQSRGRTLLRRRTGVIRRAHLQQIHARVARSTIQTIPGTGNGRMPALPTCPNCWRARK